MMNEQKTEGISIRDIFGLVLKRKIIVGVASAVAALLLVLLVAFAYNPGKQKYESSFIYHFVGIDAGKYADGTPFAPQNMISNSRLEAIKASDEDFASIDIAGMIDDGKVSIVCKSDSNTLESEDENKQTTEKIDTEEKSVLADEYKSNAYYDETANFVVNTYELVVSIDKNCFSSFDQGKAFINKLIDFECNSAKQASSNIVYGKYLVEATNAEQYDERIDLLFAQKEFLMDSYDEIINNYGDIVVNGKKVSYYQVMLKNYFLHNDMELLMVELELEGYVKNLDASQAELELSKEKQMRIINDNNQLYAELEASLAVYDVPTSTVMFDDHYGKILSEIALSNYEANRKIAIIDKKLAPTYTAQEKEAFESKVGAYDSKLAGFTTDYENVMDKIYTDNTFVYYNLPTIINSVGGINLILAAVLGIAIGAILSASIVVLIEAPKLDELRKKQD